MLYVAIAIGTPVLLLGSLVVFWVWFQSGDETSEDEGEACIACGSTTDRAEVGPGVYVCLCGYEGGPGMRAWQWSQQCERLAGLSDSQKTAQRARRLDEARMALEEFKAVCSQLDAPMRTIQRTMGKSSQARNDAFEECTTLCSRASVALHQVVAELEVVQHLAQGTGQMDDARTRIDAGSTDWPILAGPDIVEEERRRLRAIAADLQRRAASLR